MKLTITQVKNMKMTDELAAFIEKKMANFAKLLELKGSAKKSRKDFLAKYKTLGEIFLELEYETRHHRKGPFFKAEARVSAPGKNIVAAAEAENIKAAINQLAKELQREFSHYAQKKISVRRRHQRQVKQDLHLAEEAKITIPKGGRILEEGM